MDRLRFFRPEVAPLKIHEVLSFLVSLKNVTSEVKNRRRSPKPHDGSSERFSEMEKELVSLREHLQTVIQEQETANEELQALNEELQSTNEELQSSNEELETSNEELQATNEELTTLNEEINLKTSELIALNEQLEGVQNAVDYPLLVLDRNLGLVRYNSSSPSLFIIGEGDVGRHVRLLSAKTDITAALEKIEECRLKKERRFAQLETPLGAFRVHCDPIVSLSGRLDGVVVAFIENTHLVRTVRELEIKDAMVQSILQFTPAAVSLKDTSGRYTLVNPKFCELAATERDKILGQTDEDVFDADTCERIREMDYEVLKRRKSVEAELKLTIKGKERVFLCSKFPTLDDQKVPKAICTIALDVTDRAQKERELKLIRDTISASNEGILIFEATEKERHTLRFISSSFARMTGYGREDVYGLSIPDLLELLRVRTETIQVPEIREHIRRGDKLNFRVLGVRKDGQERWFDFRFTHSTDSRGRIAHTVLIVFDVTEQKLGEETILRQQQELVRAGKLSALGEMAAGIAHELNTPLNAIQGNVDLLEQLSRAKRLDTGRVLEAAANIERTVEKIGDVITGLRSIARDDGGAQFRWHNLVRLIEETSTLCGYYVRNNGVALRIDAPMSDLYVRCQPTQLSQVLINLITNAVDAVSQLMDKWILIQLRQEGNEAVIRVIDSGQGIPAALAEKIMVPFFTTKAAGKGTGLGLSLSSSIIKMHEGTFRVDPTCPNTCFEVRLPLPKRK